MRQKGSALLPVVIIIILIGVLGYFVYQNTQFKSRVANPSPTITSLATNSPEPSSTPNPTANWETYAGDGYNLKYPGDYTAAPVAFVSSPNYSSGTSVKFQNMNSSITVTESINSQNLTLANALGNGPELSYAQSFLSGKTIQNYSIGGVPGVGVENISAGQSGIALDVIWIKNGRIYQATTSSSEGAIILNQILSTFKFTQ